jgi:rRNA maturation endonuclease Nob1
MDTNFGMFIMMVGLVAIIALPILFLTGQIKTPPKKCPSCANRCAENADTCPKCGHNFDEAS